MVKQMIKMATAAFLLFAMPQMASANVIEYDVSSARSSGGCSHGLFVAAFGSGCNQRFDIQDGSVFSLDTNAQTASFTGSAINARGQVAQINLNFSDFFETTQGTGFRFRDNSGINFDPRTDTPDIDFFRSGSGTITIDGQRFFLNSRDAFRSNTLFQFGTGADIDRDQFSGSAWLNLLNRFGRSIGNADINLNLTRRPGTPVPAPAGLGLMALGLAGLGLGLRRRGRKQPA